MTAGVLLRSVAYSLVQATVTPVYSVVALLTFPFGPLTRYRIITSWSHLMVWTAARICALRYRVIGADNIPRTPFVALVKHESAWETLALQVILPPQVWVVKRELLWIPFFGWGLRMLSPIAIDRRLGIRALRQMVQQGRDRIAKGFSIVIFPEGTRSAPGTRSTYHPGGAWLATQASAPVLPIAHNAGDYWPRNGFLKHPGVITVSIAPALNPDAQCDPVELTRRVQIWIEDEVARIRAA
jgi:1-acyl-sn-glycerol-3-phosphate acyltransferase